MRSAGLTDHEQLVRTLLEAVDRQPVSLEVCADEPDEIRRQAGRLAGWGSNLLVKVPRSLGWAPALTIPEAIQRTLAWLDANESVWRDHIVTSSSS